MNLVTERLTAEDYDAAVGLYYTCHWTDVQPL